MSLQKRHMQQRRRKQTAYVIYHTIHVSHQKKSSHSHLQQTASASSSNGRRKNHIEIHLAIQNCVISFASSTNPISNSNCVVPLTALSRALKIHACV